MRHSPAGGLTPGASAWFNAFDPRDSVALYPLDPEHFRLNPEKPAIENWPKVHNFTENRHGIKGYLGDPVVAQSIYAALRVLTQRWTDHSRLILSRFTTPEAAAGLDALLEGMIMHELLATRAAIVRNLS